jgi:hypothetical protein
MMRRIITALFHSKVTARRAAERLRALGLPEDRIGLHSATGEDAVRATSRAPGSEHGLLQVLDALFLPRADFDAHLEALRRGGIVVTADTEEERAAAIRQALQESGAEDLDAHEQDWLRQGWHPKPVSASARAPAGAQGKVQGRPEARRLPYPGPTRSYAIAPPAEDSSLSDDVAAGRRDKS